MHYIPAIVIGIEENNPAVSGSVVQVWEQWLGWAGLGCGSVDTQLSVSMLPSPSTGRLCFGLLLAHILNFQYIEKKN